MDSDSLYYVAGTTSAIPAREQRTRHSIAANTACLEFPIAGRTGRGYAQSDGCRSISCCDTSMTRLELEHAIRASCDVAGDDEVYVFGPQAILGHYPDAPESPVKLGCMQAECCADVSVRDPASAVEGQCC
jgi:hypothetical protein